MKIINLFYLVILFFVLINSTGGADYGPIDMREDANITLDGGIIEKFQTKGFYNIEAFGANGSDSAGDWQAIQDGINYTNINPGYLYCPPGTYLIDGRYYDSGDVVEVYNSTMLRIKSNVHLVGVPGKTIFKVADNMRTTEDSCSILFNWNGSYSAENWSIDGIIFDGNIENNDVLTGWGSTYDAIGARNASNYSIQNCVFQNMVGRWAIYVNQSTGGSAYVQNNRVIGRWGNSSVVPDWTAMYLSGDYIYANHNTIIPDAEPSAFGATGLEFHPGVFAIATNNIVDNLISGIYASTTNGNASFYLYGNSMKIRSTGIASWNFAGHVIGTLDIANNYIEYGESGFQFWNGIDISYAHQLNSGYAKDVIVRGNTIKSGDGAPMWGIRANDYVNLTMTDNFIYGPNKCGITILNNATPETKTAIVDRNTLIDCGSSIGTNALDCAIWATIDYALPQLRINQNDIYSDDTNASIFVYSSGTPNANITIHGNVANDDIGYTPGIVGTKTVQINGAVF